MAGAATAAGAPPARDVLTPAGTCVATEPAWPAPIRRSGTMPAAGWAAAAARARLGVGACEYAVRDPATELAAATPGLAARADRLTPAEESAEATVEPGCRQLRRLWSADRQANPTRTPPPRKPLRRAVPGLRSSTQRLLIGKNPGPEKET